MGLDLPIIYDILWTSIFSNVLGILTALCKSRLVMSSKINKTFTKTSVWMLVQLIVGMTACIFSALIVIYHKEVVHVIGETAVAILVDVLYFIIKVMNIHMDKFSYNFYFPLFKQLTHSKNIYFLNSLFKRFLL